MSSERIITHMNKDHQLALGDYLAVYGKIANVDESTPAITKIDLQSLTISYVANGKKDSYTFKWEDAAEDEKVAVKEDSDLKAKLVAMAKYAATKRGYSHTKIDIVLPPTLAQSILYLIALVLALNSYDATLLPRLVASDSILSKVLLFVPGPLASLYGAVAKHSYKILLTVLVVHILEILFISTPIFKKYRVPTEQRIKWVAMQFFEGFPVIQRLKSLAQ